MSLQVWLPLTGNIENQGLANCTISGTPAYGDGKLGKALDLINSGKITISCPALNNKSQFSICFWIKGSKDTNDGDWASPIRFTSNKTGGTENNHFRFGKDNRADQTGYPIAEFNNSDFPITTTNVGLSGQSNWDNWIHICFSTNGTLVKRYLNGQYIAEYNYGTGGWLTGTITLRDARYNGFLNDFRVYDRVLDDWEIKEIARGKVLHYLLDRRGFGQDNLLIDTQKDKNNSHTTYNIADFNFSESVVADDVYTITAKVISSQDKKGIGFYHSGGSYIMGGWMPISSSGIYVKTFTATSNMASQTGGSGHGYCRVYLSNNNAAAQGSTTVTGTGHVEWIKIEKGSVATPWIPNSADALYTTLGLNNNVEYDTSGLNNNGQMISTLSYTTNSPRYQTSTIFNGVNSAIAAGRGAMVRDAITISLWGYMTDWSTYAQRLISCTEGGGWNFEPGSSKMRFACGTGTTSNTYKTITSTKTLASLSSGWHMFTGTYDGFQQKIYIDGVLEGTNDAYTEKTPLYYHSSNGVFVGAEAGSSSTTPGSGYYFNGYISDVRVYATALSAEDIADLYNGLF